MGNRDDLFGDDFDFGDEDDLFGSEDDEFDLEDDNDSDFAFEDDDDNVELDTAFGLDGGDIEDDSFFEDEDEGGTNRTFIILALLMILLFIAGLVVVVILATRDSGPSDVELESTRIAELNNADMTAFAVSQTESFIAAQTQDAATFAAQTSTAEWEATNIPLTMTAEAESTAFALTESFLTEQASIITPTPTPDLQSIQQTQQAQQLTATADALTAEAAGNASPTPPAVSTVIGVSDVQLTATAIAALFQTPIGGDAVTPIGGVDTDGQGGGSPILPTAIPNTGLFDGTNNGASLGIMGLIALALVSVIFGARSLRAANTRKL